MTMLNAIATRISSRRYLPEPIAPERQREMRKTLTQLEERSGLHLQLICDRPEPFNGITKSYGMFTGVQHYLLLAGPASDPNLEEKCGYYGEQAVLAATAMGLGTCWIGGTYDKSACLKDLKEGEKLVCVIALGHTPENPGGKQKLIRRVVRHKTKALAELASGGSRAPSWFMSGAAAVQRAPSAMNRQGYRFVRKPDDTVEAVITETGPFDRVDLGIAKLHFEIGAHGGSWTWGSSGVFRKAREEKSCGAVIWREAAGSREYLLACHRDGHWSFPKGHTEGEETEAETARREILEETGLSAAIDTGFRQVVTFYPSPGVIKDVVFFLASVEPGTERPQEEEISALRWASFPEARELITFATDEEVLLSAEEHLHQSVQETQK